MKLQIGSVLTDYDGRQIMDADTAMPLTIRHLLRVYLGSYLPDKNQSGSMQVKESVIANAVAIKVHNCNGQLEITDEEYEVLLKATEKPMHGAMVFAQVREIVESGQKDSKITDAI